MKMNSILKKAYDVKVQIDERKKEKKQIEDEIKKLSNKYKDILDMALETDVWVEDVDGIEYRILQSTSQSSHIDVKPFIKAYPNIASVTVSTVSQAKVKKLLSHDKLEPYMVYEQKPCYEIVKID